MYCDHLVLPAVSHLHVVRTAMTAVRIGWESPDVNMYDLFKGYQIYLSETDSLFSLIFMQLGSRRD